MKFYRIYIELTNVCGLKCSFCPTKNLPNKTMSLDFFESIIKQAKNYTKEIACHVVGDPFTLPNLNEYLDIIDKYGLKALLTTSGYYMKKQLNSTLFHPCVKQINISLNAFNKNDSSITFEQYIEPIITLCKAKEKEAKEIFINLRMWNLDSKLSEDSYNQEVFTKLEESFGVKIEYKNPKESVRLAYKTLLHFDTYFQWPSLANPIYGHGTCQGLSSHIGILANGDVVPCCLDSEAVMKLGNLTKQSLFDILNGKRAKSIKEGFAQNICSEEMCLKCSYKDRFNS